MLSIFQDLDSHHSLTEWQRDCTQQMHLDHENEVFFKLVLLAETLGHTFIIYALELPTSASEPSFS